MDQPFVDVLVFSFQNNHRWGYEAGNIVGAHPGGEWWLATWLDRGCESGANAETSLNILCTASWLDVILTVTIIYNRYPLIANMGHKNTFGSVLARMPNIKLNGPCPESIFCFLGVLSNVHFYSKGSPFSKCLFQFACVHTMSQLVKPKTKRFFFATASRRGGLFCAFVLSDRVL